MKKIPILLILLAVFVTTVSAEKPDPFELPFGVSMYLFPEYQYTRNPAILNDLRRELVKPVISASVDHNAATDTRTVDGPGTTGGTESSSTWTASAAAGARWLNPLDGGGVLSVYGELRPWLSTTETKSVNYNAATEDNTVSNADGSYRIIASADYGTRMDFGDIGFGGSYTFNHDPVQEEFDRRTDVALNGGNEFIDDNSILVSNLGHWPSVSVGVRVGSDEMDLGIAARGTASFNDTSEQYIAVDKDADGFDDSVVSYNEYAVNTDWGLGMQYYENKNTDTAFSAVLYPYMIRPLSGGNQMVLSGYYYLLGRNENESYQRGGAGELDTTKSITDRSLTTGSVFAGIATETDFGAELRYGARLYMHVARYSSIDLDNAGISTYDANNTGNLTEINWGAEPDNGDVINSGELSLGIDGAVHILAGLLWPVNDAITIYGDGDFYYRVNLDRYQVFDTGTTGTVWTEWATDHSIDLYADFDAGLYITLPNDAFITISGTIPMYLSPTSLLDWSADDVPSQPTGDSTAVTRDISDTSSTDFGLYISYTIRR